MLGALPEPVVELLVEWGPGRICGTFELPDPRGDGWDRLRERALAWHRQGYWLGLAGKFEELTFLARDRRGAGLAYGEGEYVFLGARGEVLRAGRTLAELVETFLGKHVHLTYDVQIAGRLRTYVDLGVEPVYVARGAHGIAEYLEALARNDESLLEGALTSEPVVLAYVHTLAALCSPVSDHLEDDVRSEAIRTIVTLARRRDPALLRLVLPEAMASNAPFRDPAVRAWTASNLELSVAGPLLREPAQTAALDLHDHSLRSEEYWPYVDAEVWIAAADAAWRGTALESVASRFAGHARRLSTSFLVPLVRQLEQLDSHQAVVASAPGGQLAYDDAWKRAEGAESRVRRAVRQGRALLALAAMGTREAVCVRATRLLAGVVDDELADMWLRLIVATEPPMPHGADAFQFAHNYTAATRVEDRLVEHLLPALAAGSHVAAILLASRTDRHDVLTTVLEHYAEIALAGPWPPSGEGRRVVTQDDPRAREAIERFLGLEGPTRRRSLCPAAIGEEGAHALVSAAHYREGGGFHMVRPSLPHHVSPPWRPGPLGSVTRALVDARDERTVAVLRKTATSKRTPIDVRDEAVKGLVALRAPGADELVATLNEAWRRHWKL